MKHVKLSWSGKGYAHDHSFEAIIGAPAVTKALQTGASATVMATPR